MKGRVSEYHTIVKDLSFHIGFLCVLLAAAYSYLREKDENCAVGK